MKNIGLSNLSKMIVRFISTYASDQHILINFLDHLYSFQYY